jgi:hypothetical protein
VFRHDGPHGLPLKIENFRQCKKQNAFYGSCSMLGGEWRGAGASSNLEPRPHDSERILDKLVEVLELMVGSAISRQPGIKKNAELESTRRRTLWNVFDAW